MLETEIKKLTAQIELLNKNFESICSGKLEAPKVEAEVEKKEVKKEVKKEAKKEAPATASITAESLKTLCLEKVRVNRANGKKIKSILAAVSAEVIDDLDVASYMCVHKAIGAL